MTTKERLVELLTEMGIVVEVDDYGCCVIEAGYGPKQRGYAGHLVAFEFDPSGDELVKVGIYG